MAVVVWVWVCVCVVVVLLLVLTVAASCSSCPRPLGVARRLGQWVASPLEVRGARGSHVAWRAGATVGTGGDCGDASDHLRLPSASSTTLPSSTTILGVRHICRVEQQQPTPVGSWNGPPLTPSANTNRGLTPLGVLPLCSSLYLLPCTSFLRHNRNIFLARGVQKVTRLDSIPTVRPHRLCQRSCERSV